MNLNLIVDKVIDQEIDEEIIGDLAEIAALNILQFKCILLQKNKGKKIKVIYKVLQKLIYIEEIQQFIFLLLEGHFSQFSLPYELFMVLQKLIIFPQYQRRIVFGLINFWQQNYLRIPTLQLINNLLILNKQKQMFILIYCQILQVFPMQIDYQIQRQNAQKLNHISYFDDLISQVIKFLFYFKNFVPQMKQQCISYLISFSKIKRFYKIIYFETKKQLFSDKNSSNYQRILSITIKDNLFEYDLISEYHQFLQNTCHLYCKQISNILVSFELYVQLSIEQIEQKLRSVLLHIRLAINYFDDIQQSGITIIEWLRLLQMIMDISERQKKLIVYRSIFEVIEITKQIIKQIKSLKMGISIMLINNIPYSIDTLILLSNQQFIPKKLFIHIKDKITLIDNIQHRTALWKKILKQLEMQQYSELNDYGMVNILGLEAVDNWKIDTDKLIEIHQRAIFQNKQQQLQDIETIIQYISLHSFEQQLGKNNS